MADIVGTKNIANFINVFRQTISENLGKENPETVEEVFKKHGIDWNDFLDDDGEGNWGFDFEAFNNAVNNKK